MQERPAGADFRVPFGVPAWRTRLAALALAIGLAAPAPVRAQGSFFTFHEIFVTGPPPPGSDIPFEFTSFLPPSIDGLDIAFNAGTRTASQGIYKATLSRRVRKVVDTDDRVSGERFSSLGGVTLDEGWIVFVSVVGGETRLYSATPFLTPGLIAFTPFATSQTVFPGMAAPLPNLEVPTRDRGHLIVSANNSPLSPPASGVYASGFATPTGFRVVADTNPLPGGGSFFNVDQGVAGGGAIVFHRNNAPGGPHFLHWIREQDLGIAEPEVLIGTSPNLLIPDGSGIFDSLSFPVVDGNEVVFFARDRRGQPGLYKVMRDGVSNPVVVVANTNTPIPEGTGNFTGFGIDFAIDGGDVVFEGRGENFQSGLYLAQSDGTLRKIIDGSDLLDGEPICCMRIGREAIDYDRIVFTAFVGPGIAPPMAIIAATYGLGALNLPGASQLTPLLPTTTQPGRFQFVNVPTGQWLDPPLVPGYEYVMDSPDAGFAAILEFPEGFDQPFEVVVDDQLLGAFGAGDAVHFEELLGSSVRRFTVRNIEPQVDAEDPTAFPLRLAFTTERADFTMQALPEPGLLGMLSLLLGLALRRGRRR